MNHNNGACVYKLQWRVCMCGSLDTTPKNEREISEFLLVCPLHSAWFKCVGVSGMEHIVLKARF